MGAFNFHHLHPVLSHLPNIRKLELEYTNCNDSTLQVIANNCPLLKELNVYASMVTDEGLRYLCFPSHHKLELETLTVSRTNVKYIGVMRILKHMPSIRVISHENLSSIIADAVLRKQLTKDRPLGLTFIEVHCASTELRPIADLCPNIKQLFVKNIGHRDQLLYCSAFKALKDVCLCYTSRDTPVSIDQFLETCGQHINNLSLENFILSVNVLVRSCPNLEILELCDPIFKEFSDERVLPSLRFEKLTYFKMYGSSLVSMKDIASPAFIINSSLNLESMALEYCFIGANMEDVILQCPATLKQLDFRESLVNINFLQEVLYKHKSLQCLIIENSGVLNEDFQKLWQLSDSLNHPVNIMWC